jgi:hypothetical protein
MTAEPGPRVAADRQSLATMLPPKRGSGAGLALKTALQTQGLLSRLIPFRSLPTSYRAFAPDRASETEPRLRSFSAG